MSDDTTGRIEDGWIDLGPDDLREGELRALEIDGRFVLLARCGGALAAMDDMCNHAGCLLSGGWIDAKKSSVVCPCHEIEFDLRTGRNLTWPRLCGDQPSHAVRVEAGRALVRLGGA